VGANRLAAPRLDGVRADVDPARGRVAALVRRGRGVQRGRGARVRRVAACGDQRLLPPASPHLGRGTFCSNVLCNAAYPDVPNVHLLIKVRSVASTLRDNVVDTILAATLASELCVDSERFTTELMPTAELRDRHAA